MHTSYPPPPPICFGNEWHLATRNSRCDLSAEPGLAQCPSFALDQLQLAS